MGKTGEHKIIPKEWKIKANLNKAGGISMNSLYMFGGISFAFLGLLLFTSCSTSLYPPSKYIGLFDWYNGYKNGELPNDQKFYTGKWQVKYPNSSNVNITGFYKNGLPDGIWNSYYFFGNIHLTAVYIEGQQKQFISYYPDGIPQNIHLPNEQKISFYPDGSIVEKRVAEGKNKKITGWSWNPIYRLSPFYKTKIIEGQNIEIDTYLFLSSDNTFALWYFMITETDIKKGVIEGKLNSENGNLSSLHNKVYYGNVKPEFSASRSNNFITMELILKNENKKPITVQIQIYLMHPSHTQSQEMSISHAIF